jgi:Asp-tRNA(Asn)/Glu-tRNA(Gln) amidotransferase B subunit
LSKALNSPITQLAHNLAFIVDEIIENNAPQVAQFKSGNEKKKLVLLT